MDPTELDEAMDLRERIANALLSVSQSELVQKTEEAEVTLESPW